MLCRLRRTAHDKILLWYYFQLAVEVLELCARDDKFDGKLSIYKYELSNKLSHVQIDKTSIKSAHEREMYTRPYLTWLPLHVGAHLTECVLYQLNNKIKNFRPTRNNEI